MKLYKLTDTQDMTQGKTQWGKNIIHKHKKKDSPQLCSPDVFHAYKNINLAFLLNPIHANIFEPHIWEAEGKIAVEDWGKVGCFKLKTIKRLPIPKWVGGEDDQRIRVKFAILCAKSVFHFYEEKYPTDKRVRNAIEAAENYLTNPAEAAWAAEAAGAARAARAAAGAAEAARAAWAAAEAAWAAEAAGAAWAARAAAEAAEAAAEAAEAAAEAAAWAEPINFPLLADEAVREVK